MLTSALYSFSIVFFIKSAAVWRLRKYKTNVHRKNMKLDQRSKTKSVLLQAFQSHKLCSKVMVTFGRDN